MNLFTIRTGIFQSGIPITGTSYYFYMVALADWVTICSQYPIGETFQPDAADNVEVQSYWGNMIEVFLLLVLL